MPSTYTVIMNEENSRVFYPKSCVSGQFDTNLACVLLRERVQNFLNDPHLSTQHRFYNTKSIIKQYHMKCEMRVIRQREITLPYNHDNTARAPMSKYTIDWIALWNRNYVYISDHISFATGPEGEQPYNT